MNGFAKGGATKCCCGEAARPGACSHRWALDTVAELGARPQRGRLKRGAPATRGWWEGSLRCLCSVRGGGVGRTRGGREKAWTSPTPCGRAVGLIRAVPIRRRAAWKGPWHVASCAPRRWMSRGWTRSAGDDNALWSGLVNALLYRWELSTASVCVQRGRHAAHVVEVCRMFSAVHRAESSTNTRACHAHRCCAACMMLFHKV